MSLVPHLTGMESTGPTPRVLILDDHRIMRLMLQDLLTHAKYAVTPAETAAEAWELMLQPFEDQPFTLEHTPVAVEPFEMLIIDRMLPGMDGMDMVRKVREHPKLRSTYIIFVTAKGRTEDLVAGLESGADEYVAKPFEPTELLARVKAGLRIRALQRELAHYEHQLAAVHLATTAAHEINNPLMILLGNLDLLRKKLEQCGDAEIATRLENINRAAERIHKVANSLRSLKEVRLKTYANKIKMIELENVSTV